MKWKSPPLWNILYHKRTLIFNEVIAKLNAEYDHIAQDWIVDEHNKKAAED